MGIILHFDIETVSIHDTTIPLTDKETIDIWDKKYSENNDISRMPLYAEFSKVLCISFGYEIDGVRKIISISGDNEKDLLERATVVFDKGETLAGFNILGFDMPFLCKRYIVNGLKIPNILNNFGKKPREIKAIDIMKMWASGGTSAGLETICYVLGIKSPKEGDVKGSTLNELYWDAKKHNSIENLIKNTEIYCEKDVYATMDVYNKIIDSF